MKSISLNQELKQKVSELQKHTQSIATQDEVEDLENLCLNNYQAH
jgi:hypothetical protein